MTKREANTCDNIKTHVTRVHTHDRESLNETAFE